MLKKFGAQNGKLRVGVVGANGGIGGAFVDALDRFENVETIYCLSRSRFVTRSSKTIAIQIDLTDDGSLQSAAEKVRADGDLDVFIIATGILHDDDTMPEKDWRNIRSDQMAKLFAINTIGPAVLMSKFADLLSKDRPSVIAALSARVGSISDNRLGGWYSYRASKAALNQIIKTFSIELARKRKHAIIVGLHPGTVDTDLSQPFRGSFQDRFTPNESVQKLLQVLDTLQPEQSGSVLDWTGKTIPA